MSFFPPEPEPVTPAEPEMVDRLDPLAGNFPGYLGVPVSLELDPIRTEHLAITMDHFRAFPGGFYATLITIARPGHMIEDRGIHPGRATGPGRLRIGLELSDGRRGYVMRDRVDGSAFAIAWRGSGGGPFRFRHQLWVRVVPPHGPMDLVVAWADEDLPETRLTIATDALIDAIGSVSPVWDDRST